MDKTFVLKPLKTTAGTYVYGQVDDTPAANFVPRNDSTFPALYLPKSLFPNGPTATIEVTLRVPS